MGKRLGVIYKGDLITKLRIPQQYTITILQTYTV